MRITEIKKHGDSACVSITREIKKLGWKPGDTVKVEPNGDQIVITHVEVA